MILLDKLSYSSPIRRQSPGLKCLFAVGSLLVCVGFRQPGVCALIFLCMAGCTLRLANVSPGRYLRFLAGPAVFLALSSAAILFYLSSAPQDLFSLALGPRYLGVSSQSLASWLQLMAVAFSSVCLPIFSDPHHPRHRPAGSAAAPALSLAAAGADAADLPRHLCPVGHRRRHSNRTELPVGEPLLLLQAALHGTDAFGAAGALAEKILPAVRCDGKPAV